MANPFGVATKGKGFYPMLVRGWVIASRYGLTTRKMDSALGQLSNTVTQFACSSTLPVTASALASNPTAAMFHYVRGQELAIHGLQHVDYSLLSKDKQLRHLHQAVRIFQSAGIPIAGFRCPYLRWNAGTLEALSEVGFKYDSSQALKWDVTGGLESEAYNRVLKFYRAQSANDYPALPRLVNGLVRIPYCLPDDEALVERLHLSAASSMAEIWLAILERTHQTGELFTLGLHPERVLLCQQALVAVLEKARSLSPCVWIARLDEITSWYLALGKSTFELKPEPGDLFHVRIHAPTGVTILIRSVDVNYPSQVWVHDYRTVLSNEFTVRSSRRPVIGVSPESPDSLRQFLRHQGYLIEVNTDRQAYSNYLDRTSFQEEDERGLLAELESSRVPLVRLSRWPDGNCSALTITGDVDAFSILDFGRRILYN